MGFLDGLYIYEIVLLFAGILFFLVALFLLVYIVLVTKDTQKIKYLLPCFAVSIVMIGFPSITKIKIGSDFVELEKQTERAENNPSDSTIRAGLSETIQKLEKRPISNFDDLINLAEANFVVGDTLRARNNLLAALDKKPNSQKAKNLLKKIP